MNDPASNVEAWMGKAEEDRLCIRNNLAAATVPWAVVCFHAQQAVEKYLKAFLIAQAVRVERTHDLEYLLGECLRYDPSLAPLQDDCQALAAFAVDSRYPDVLPDDDEPIGRQAVTMCDRICGELRRRLTR
jgi:HEPN domain-containing protein